MNRERHHLTIPQGTTWSVSWPILEDGEHADIEDWTVRSQVRPGYESNVVLYEWSTDADNVFTDNSQVTLVVTPEVSSDWTWSTGVYDVELTNPEGETFRVAQGRIRVSREVTR